MSNENFNTLIEKCAEKEQFEILRYSGCGLTECPAKIGQLGSLTELDLSDNELSILPSAIGQLNSLTHLNLTNNNLKILPSTIGALSHLMTLNLFGNNLEELPNEIFQLSNLSKLYLSYNNLASISPEIQRLQNLTDLYIRGNNLTEIPIEIGKLKKLKRLYIGDNHLTSIPKEISELKNLRRLNLTSNMLSEIHPDILNLQNLTKLNLFKNPLENPPYEVSIGENNIEKLRNYFKDLKDQGEVYIYEAKLIIVGDPRAGKTSLSRKFLNPKSELNLSEPMTKGIDILKWTFKYTKDKIFTANIWDFGGQEIMHATHRYFLTKRSLYLIVSDNSEEKTDFYYWLNLVELLGKNSPVLIVLNEKYDYKKSIPSDIFNSFENFLNHYDVNLADNKGLNSLFGACKKQLCALPHVGKDPIPKNWANIRSKLEFESQTKNYISRREYLTICKSQGVDEEEKALYISEFLHDLGVILHFQEDRLLRNTVILNPIWATEAVYLIIFDKIVNGNLGNFDNKDLERIWNLPEYNTKYADLLQLMIKFELCYEIDNSQKYVIPELLPEKPIDKNNYFQEKIQSSGSLRFEYRYTFMPKGIVSRLIVRMNKYIFENLQWRNGVVLVIEGAYATITEHHYHKKMSIRISGENKIHALAIIRNRIKGIHEIYDKLDYVEMIPCNCIKCKNDQTPHFYSYHLLRRYEQEGIQNIRCDKSLKNADVLSLISDLKLPYELRDKERIGKTFLEDRYTVDKMEKTIIHVCDGASVHGNITISEAIKNSFNTVNQAEVSDELNSKLEELFNIVNKNLSTLPTDRAIDTSQDLDNFLKEVTKKQPRKKWYNLSSEGLLDAAKEIGASGKSIVELVSSILKLIG